MSWGGPAKIGCDGGVLLQPYVPLGIKRHKSSKSSNITFLSKPYERKGMDSYNH